MDIRRYVVIGVPAIIATTIKIIFNLDTLISAIIFGASLYVSYYIAKQTGYWKMPVSKKPIQPTT